MIISLVLISVVLLSVSATFAADDNAALGGTDEIAVEETINSVEVTDEPALAEDAAEPVAADDSANEEIISGPAPMVPIAEVSKETFFNYFDDSGSLLGNVTSEELIFNGNFTGINVNYITIDRPIKLTGNDAVFNNVCFVLLADNIRVDGFTLTQSNDVSLFNVGGTTNVTLSNNNIEFIALEGFSCYAIYANAVSALNIINNTITFIGNTASNDAINNVIRVEGDEHNEISSNSIFVNGNTFDITIPSVDVNYDYWPDTITYSEGIVFYYCEDVEFCDNVINLRYNNFITKYGYDSIYVVSVKGNPYNWDAEGPIACSDVLIKNNTINAVGHSYIYGISVSAYDVEVSDNVLNITSEGYYANGITVNGPSNGEVIGNNITLAAENVVYGIYSAQYDGGVNDMTYSGNIIDVDAYFACGMELMERNPVVAYNVITANGNHTSGIIASISGEAQINNNEISSLGNNIGTEPTGDDLLPLNSVGIAIKGKHTIAENVIEASSIGIDLVENGPSTITNNNISVIAVGSLDNYGIHAFNYSDISITKNNIEFVGSVGVVVNNAIRIEGDEKKEHISSNIDIKDNTFDIILPSVDVNYDNWPDTITYSEGILFYYCEDVEFSDNIIDLRYDGVFTSFGYDSIYVVSARGNPYNWDAEYPIACYDIVIVNNTINAVGHSYIYGISVSAYDVEVSDNVLDITSEGYYANGITVNGPSNGDVIGNNITLAAENVVYGIYSAQYDGGVNDMTYSGNIIDVDAYFACGMELMERNPVVAYNVITANGNHTSGIIASISGEAQINNNEISSLGNNIGTEPTGDDLLPLNSVGIAIKGKHTISENVIEASSIGIDLVENGPSTITNNNISVIAVGSLDNYGIHAFNYSDISITKNNIKFVGSVETIVVNNAIRIEGDEKKEHISANIDIKDNTFDITLPSVDVNYDTWPDTITYSEGILFYYCEDVEFSDNIIDLRYDGVFTSFGYDSIYVVSARGNPYNWDAEEPIACYDIVIVNNTINAVGHAYIYGISVAVNDVEVSDNVLDITSEGYYANGITVNGPSNGEVIGNEINLVANNVTYGIYSSQYDGGVMDMTYSDNTIFVDSYAACGMELMERNPVVSGNEITATGNYTYGIVASISGETQINNNTISSLGNNVGTIASGDGLLPLNSVGISVKGIALVKDNIVESTGTGLYGYQVNLTLKDNVIKAEGDYAIDLYQSNATVTDNYLSSKNGVGDESITGEKVIAASGNVPYLKTVLSAVDLFTVFDSGDLFYVIAKDENGDPIKNATIRLIYNGEALDIPTDENGIATFYIVEELDVGEYPVVISYAGNDTYGPKSIDALVVIAPRPINIVAPTSANVLLTAIKKGSYYNIVLTDDRGQALVGEEVTITFNGKSAIYTTDASGAIKYKLEATKVGTQQLIVKFDSNPDYVASTLTATIKITKEATKLTAAKKTFKAKVKTKKYTVTLKDSKGKAIKKVKLTLKIKGKTYKATTNAKGKATFKIKKLTKKGKYTAKVAFAGNGLYNKVAKSVKITVKK